MLAAAYSNNALGQGLARRLCPHSMGGQSNNFPNNKNSALRFPAAHLGIRPAYALRMNSSGATSIMTHLAADQRLHTLPDLTSSAADLGVGRSAANSPWHPSARVQVILLDMFQIAHSPAALLTKFQPCPQQAFITSMPHPSDNCLCVIGLAGSLLGGCSQVTSQGCFAPLAQRLCTHTHHATRLIHLHCAALLMPAEIQSVIEGWSSLYQQTAKLQNPFLNTSFQTAH